MNRSGKTLTIFLFVIAILLISLTAISVFFFLKEVDLRKSAEYNLDQMEVTQSKLQGDLKEAKKQIEMYVQKGKEADDKIEKLNADLELEQGLKEKLKDENRQLTEKLDAETKSKEELRAQMSKDLASAEEKIKELNDKIDLVTKQKDEMDARRKELEDQYNQMKAKAEAAPAAPVVETPKALEVAPAAAPTPAPVPDEKKTAPAQPGQKTESKNVELKKIVVNPAGEDRGKVISVDQDTNFVIVSLGEKDGVKKDQVLSISRGDTYLGDVKVSRVLPEMSAADFVAPLTSQQVLMDDRVAIKK